MDFAGSGVVHAVGGFVALAGCLIIGPRIVKYSQDGKPNPIPGHSTTLAVLGALILWFGWFGFNAGSTLSAYELRISVIAVNTNLAAAAGAVVAMVITWIKFGKADLAMTVNGAIAGLVGITAACARVAPWASLLIGGVAGAIVCYAFWFLERRGVDDVVGAISVHAFGGIWGLLALGIFVDGTYGNYTTDGLMITGLLYGNPGFFAVQLISAAVCLLWALGLGLLLFYGLKKIMGVRVSAEEMEGPNLAYRPRYKGGYFPVPPTDSMYEIRSMAMMKMMRTGIEVEVHHHEVATAGQDDQWLVTEKGVRHPSDQIGRTWAQRGQADPRSASESGGDLGHESGSLLVSGDHQLYVGIVKGVNDLEILLTRNAEDPFHTFPL